MIPKFSALLLLACVWAPPALRAQGPPPPPHRHGPGGPDGPGGGPPGPFDRSLHIGPPGRWWSDPRLAQLLALTPDQRLAMDRVFDQNRAKLIDLNAILRKEESLLRAQVYSDELDDQKILLQIDRVANARAELEKANGRMLIALRKVLTPDQWRRLQAEGPGSHQR